ncbi:MAG: ABC transporter permease [Lactobacillus sp.]|jgi:ABC-2 type transport system permease protein|nr:ABC transporter permease [Lactobacillus sp.]
MLDLWRQRLRRHISRQFKYLRLVFNDHFVIALIFLIGALAMGYANLLKLLPPRIWWGGLVVGVLYTVVLGVGQLATLLEQADDTFLLPKESDLFHYLVAARNYSLILPTIFSVLAGIAILPLAAVLVVNFELWSGVMLILTLVILKDTQLWLALLGAYEVNGKTPTLYQHKTYFYGAVYGLILLGLYLSPFISVVLALAWNLWMRRNITGYVLEGQLRFEASIDLEASRQYKILKIYNLFTDIPSLQRHAKRRKYLDFLLKLFPANHRNTYLYLFARGFLRGTEYLGFYLRFLLIGTLILCFVHQLWVSLVLYLLFLYLSGFQLLPFFDQYDSIVFTKLYPIPATEKLAGFQKLLITILGLQWFVTSIPLVFVFGVNLQTGLMIIGGLALTIVFVFGYAKTRLKKGLAE